MYLGSVRVDCFNQWECWIGSNWLITSLQNRTLLYPCSILSSSSSSSVESFAIVLLSTKGKIKAGFLPLNCQHSTGTKLSVPSPNSYSFIFSYMFLDISHRPIGITPKYYTYLERLYQYFLNRYNICRG